jgi:hypothetical protein
MVRTAIDVNELASPQGYLGARATSCARFRRVLGLFPRNPLSSIATDSILRQQKHNPLLGYLCKRSASFPEFRLNAGEIYRPTVSRCRPRSTATVAANFTSPLLVGISQRLPEHGNRWQQGKRPTSGLPCRTTHDVVSAADSEQNSRPRWRHKFLAG